MKSKQLMIGLPETGKTTFLAALWQVVISGEIRNSLRLVKLDANSEYVDQVHRDWLFTLPVERTNFNSNQTVSMKLGLDKDQEITELVFPDMSGELFSLQWTERKWSKTYDDLVREATVSAHVNPRKNERAPVEVYLTASSP